MNKKQLVHAIADASGLKIKDSELALDAFVSSVSEAIKSGDKVVLSGFGSWESVDRAERIGRNPSNGESITIPAKKAVKFKAGKELKEIVKG